jgi:hypothetical protein
MHVARDLSEGHVRGALGLERLAENPDLGLAKNATSDNAAR